MNSGGLHIVPAYFIEKSKLTNCFELSTCPTKVRKHYTHKKKLQGGRGGFCQVLQKCLVLFSKSLEFLLNREEMRDLGEEPKPGTAGLAYAYPAHILDEIESINNDLIYSCGVWFSTVGKTDCFPERTNSGGMHNAKCLSSKWVSVYIRYLGWGRYFDWAQCNRISHVFFLGVRGWEKQADFDNFATQQASKDEQEKLYRLVNLIRSCAVWIRAPEQ